MCAIVCGKAIRNKGQILQMFYFCIDVTLLATGVLPIIFSGGLGGGCLWLVVYPMDCVKSRIQVMSMTGKQGGFFKTLMTIARSEGMQ